MILIICDNVIKENKVIKKYVLRILGRSAKTRKLKGPNG